VCVFLPFVDTFTIYGKCCLSPGPLPQERRQASGRSSPSNPLKVTFGFGFDLALGLGWPNKLGNKKLTFQGGQDIATD